MSLIQRNLLFRILSETREKSVNLVELRETIRITDEAFKNLLSEFNKDNILTERSDSITLNTSQRIGLAVKALELGADIEAISRALTWLEFEELSARVFEENGFNVHRRFRFKANGRRWEIDLLAFFSPYLICGECKRWEKGMGNQTARKIVEVQIVKNEMITKNLPAIRERVGLEKWRKVTVIPMIITLSSTPFEIYRRVPVVNVLALPRFLTEFSGQLNRLVHTSVELPKYEVGEQKKISRKKNYRALSLSSFSSI